jgi:hypothetical protein
MTDSVINSRSDLINPSRIMNKGNRIKPKFFKLLGSIMNSHMEVIAYKLAYFELFRSR